MKKNPVNPLELQIEKWYNKLRSVSWLTESDCYNLKDHLLTTIEELKESGLNDEDAFEVATMRLGQDFNFETEYGRVNADIILTRKILFIFSGIMTYCLFYFLMNITVRIIFLHSDIVGEDPVMLIRKVYVYLFSYHLFFVFLVIFIHFFSGRIFNKMINLRILPIHIILMVILVFSLVFADFKLQHLIVSKLPRVYLSLSKYYTIFSISNYSFPFVMSLCFFGFFLLSKRFSRTNDLNQDQYADKKNIGSEIEEYVKTHFNNRFVRYKESGLTEEEAIALIRKQYSILPERNIKKDINDDTKMMNTVLIVMSGILVYLLLYYFLQASTRIFLTILQHFDDDPVKNFGWIRWYITSYHLIIIFFTLSIYIKDRNLIESLKRLNIKPYKMIVAFVITIFFSITNHFFLSIARDSIGHNIEFMAKLRSILQISNLSFSFVISLCFLVLFNKYYRENVKTS